jgi:hypothetical protein
MNQCWGWGDKTPKRDFKGWANNRFKEGENDCKKIDKAIGLCFQTVRFTKSYGSEVVEQSYRIGEARFSSRLKSILTLENQAS